MGQKITKYLDWWKEIVSTNNMVVKEYCTYMCSEVFEALLIIRSTVVDIQDRHFRGTWHRLTREEKNALMTCPLTPEAARNSWELCLKSKNFLR